MGLYEAIRSGENSVTISTEEKPKPEKMVKSNLDDIEYFQCPLVQISGVISLLFRIILSISQV